LSFAPGIEAAGDVAVDCFHRIFDGLEPVSLRAGAIVDGPQRNVDAEAAVVALHLGRQTRLRRRIAAR
jgi:hypothetical protein